MEYPTHPMSGMGQITAMLLGVILFHKDYDKMFEDYWTGIDSKDYYSRIADYDRSDWLNIVSDELGWQWETLHAMCGCR
jgi:hypothetical protein